jgi:hypothetical protein
MAVKRLRSQGLKFDSCLQCRPEINKPIKIGEQVMKKAKKKPEKLELDGLLNNKFKHWSRRHEAHI